MGTTSHNRKYAGDLIDAIRDLVESGRGFHNGALLPVLASFGTELMMWQPVSRELKVLFLMKIQANMIWLDRYWVN